MLTKRKDGRFCKSKTINGNRVFFYSAQPTEKKALRDIEKQMLDYQGKIEKGPTFKQVADEWEEQHYKNIMYQTSYRYKSLVKRAASSLGNIYIKSVTPQDISQILNDMVSQKFSTKSIKDQSSVIKMIFKYAVIKRYISENPALYISPPKGQPKINRSALSDEQIKIVDQNVDKDFGLLAFLLLYSGLRRGEALALTDKDIDFENNIIYVTKSIEHHSNTPCLKEPKTQAGKRQVPLVNKLKSQLLKHNLKGIIFSQNGNYMVKSYFQTHWNNYVKTIGINITPHQLRHTFTTLLFEWNIDEKDTQEIMGHADISTTRNIYTHIRQSRLSSTLDKINSKLEENN